MWKKGLALGSEAQGLPDALCNWVLNCGPHRGVEDLGADGGAADGQEGLGLGGAVFNTETSW